MSARLFFKISSPDEILDVAFNNNKLYDYNYTLSTYQFFEDDVTSIGVADQVVDNADSLNRVVVSNNGYYYSYDDTSEGRTSLGQLFLPASISSSRQSDVFSVGSPINYTAVLSGGENPSGTVTFELYNNPNATSTPLFTDTKPLSGGGATSSYTPTALGTYYWLASRTVRL